MFQAIAETVIKKVYDKRRLKLRAIAAEFLVFLLLGYKTQPNFSVNLPPKDRFFLKK